MKVTSERGEHCEVTLTIEVEPERVETGLRQAARKISQQTNIPGFRRGKAPYPVVLQTFGRQTLLEEAVEDLGEELFKQALEETKIEPYAQAELVNVQLEPMVLKLKFPVAPVVDLGDYRSLRLDVSPVDVSDEQVSKSLEDLREQNATWLPIERGAAWGDLVTLKMATGDEEAPESRDVILREDSAYPAPGLSAKLLDAVAGESRSVEVTYPEDWYAKELAGKTETVHVTVQELKEKELPPLEELPTLIGDYADLDSLRASIRKELETTERAKDDSALVRKALDILLEQASVEFPKVMEEEELDSMMNRLETNLQQQGLDLDSYLKVLKVSKQEYRDQQRPEAAKRVKRGLILGRLSELEKLDVKGEEVSQEIEARVKPYAEEGEQLRELLTSPTGIQYVASEVLTDKAHQRLLAIVKGEAPELPAETEEAQDGAETTDPVDTAAPTDSTEVSA